MLDRIFLASIILLAAIAVIVTMSHSIQLGFALLSIQLFSFSIIVKGEYHV